MKRIILIVLIGFGSLLAQFKVQSAQPSIVNSIIRPTSLLDFQSLIDPSKLLMRQQYSLSYSSFGNEAISLGQYTNSMMYQFNENLNARFDVTLQHSPYNSLGKNGDVLNGIFLNRAEINYKPLDNLFLKLSYQKIPLMNYRNFDQGYYDSFYNW